MKTGKYILIITALICSEFFAAPFDSGYITWTQPNGVTFVARSWGDEFESWMETNDGYRIIIGPYDYFYYSVLDINGEFTYSNYKVAIDEPLQESYQLERSQLRLSEIEGERESFKQKCEQNYTDFMAEFDGPSTPPLRLAIVLIDFADSLHSSNYNKKDFDTLFFSTGYYYTDPNNPVIKSPNQEWVYGSLRDYYRDQSLNKLEIIGKFGADRSIVNPEDPNNPGKPLWVYMPEEKSYYSQNGLLLNNAAKERAESQLNLNLDQYDRIGFVLAGDRTNSYGGTWPMCYQQWTCIERFSLGGIQDQTFLNIGIPAHEFAHSIGARDEYVGSSENDPKKWGLMSTGIYNGGDAGTEKLKGSCPAPFSPYYRIKFNWVTPVILEPQEDFIVHYNYSSPYFYKINIPVSNEYFIIERRNKDGYDLYTPKFETPESPPKGILLWHIAPNANDGDVVQLEPANNIFPVGMTGVRFPLNSIQDFTDSNSPSSNKRNGDYSFVSIKNIEWIGNLQTGYAKLDYINEGIQITGTQTWATDTDLSLPVFIKNGGTLNIINGADVNITGDFADQIKFVVEDGSNFNLTGSGANKVLIHSYLPNQTWKGIEIYGSGDFDSDFASIQDAFNPISIFHDNASCSLNNTEINGNQLWLRGSIDIENSIFIDAPLYIFNSNIGSKLKANIFSSQLPNNFYVLLSEPGSSYLEVANCTFNGLNYGLKFGREGESFGDRKNEINVINNIFSNCTSSIMVYEGEVSILYNNFYNNNYNEFMGNNYLTVNPMYINPEKGDFNLQWGSGCIDAGHPTTIYNDPDGTRNDMGAKYYDQTAIVPANFTLTTGPDDHPLLQWEGAPHLHYKVYALYEYFDSSSANNEYSTLTDSYVDETVVFTEPTGEDPNQYAIYSVTSINSIDVESQHTEEIAIDAFGRLPKKSFIDSSFTPVSYNLFNPFPNPFNPSTKVVFDLPEKSYVSIKLYSITGEEVLTIVNEPVDAGRYSFLIDGNGLSSGVYLLRMISNNFVSTKKIIMMK
jgi:M6 family metalloprotease-like protein